MNGMFVTGTGTGVGKTFLAAALVAAARQSGIDAVPMKPVQTGCRLRGGRLAAPDLEFCLRVAGLRPSAAEASLMCPCRYRRPCSPHLAARLERRPVSLARIQKAFATLLLQHDAVIAEGAGGLLVPLGNGAVMADMIPLLGLPVVLAAAAGLGTLNHTLLSLNELRRRGLPVLAVVLTRPDGPAWGDIEKDNLATLRQLAGVPVYGPMPWIPGAATARAAARLSDVAAEAVGDLLQQAMAFPHPRQTQPRRKDRQP